MGIGHRIRTLGGHTLAKAWHDRILGLSAEAAFWQLLSMPSLALAAIASLGYVSRWLGPDVPRRVEQQLESTFSRAFSPDVVVKIVTPTLDEVINGQRIDIISVGFLLALWAGSSATATFVNTITIAYGMRDERGAIRSRLHALWLFLGTVLAGVIVLPLMVLGPTLLSDLFPERRRRTASAIIHDLYYPALVVLVVLSLATFYHLAPPRRLPWRRGVPGALLALVVFMGGSAGLRAYITLILSHNHAYTALAAPIAALLFFYILAFGVVLGAEFNAAIEEESPSPRKSRRARAAKAWQRLGDAPDVGAPDARPQSTP
jgi:membrane protein